jgi:hypothetical protein
VYILYLWFVLVVEAVVVLMLLAVEEAAEVV